MRIFLTGATGFIGKHLLKRLQKENYQVTALVRQIKDKDLKRRDTRFILGDIRNPSNFAKELNNCNTLVHLAALRTNWAAPQDFLEVNSKSILGMVKRKTLLKHIIVVSSVYSMGTLEYLPADESHPLNARDLYGKSKILLEEFTREIAKKYGIKYTIVRPAIVYGPGDSKSGMVIKMIDLIKKNGLPIIGNGQNLLHLIYVDDLIEGLMKIIKSSGYNETYILAYKEPITLIKLIELIKNQLKISHKDRFIPRSPVLVLAHLIEKFYLLGFKIFPIVFRKDPFISPIKLSILTDSWCYDISKAKSELGFKPKIDYNLGIKRTIQAHK